MSWDRFTVNGVHHDLKHLRPFTMRVRPKRPGAPILRVRVEFGAHCFTKELEAHHGSELHFPDGKSVRCFCTDRHKWSRSLRGIIQSSAGGPAYHSLKQSYLLVKPQAGNSPYVVCFSLRRAKSRSYDVLMVVVSAYEKDKLPKELPSSPFVALIGRVADGKPLTSGPLKAW